MSSLECISIFFVLNLIINGLPSKLEICNNNKKTYDRIKVLNLIINGLPSKLSKCYKRIKGSQCFKPYYKWTTF